MTTPHHTEAPIRTVNHHCPRCPVRGHRSDRTEARHIWPMAAETTGAGPWATLRWCRGLSVHLSPSEAEARAYLADLDRTCPKMGTHRHELCYIL